MNYYVYIIFRPNGLPCYVGKGKGRRWKKHERKTCNPHLAAIIAAAGGSLPRVKVREDLTEAEAFETEAALIAAIGREVNGGPLVNLTDGGEGSSGRRHSPTTKAKMRIAALNASPRKRELLRAAQTGRRASPEARRAMSEAAQRRTTARNARGQFA